MGSVLPGRTVSTVRGWVCPGCASTLSRFTSICERCGIPKLGQIDLSSDSGTEIPVVRLLSWRVSDLEEALSHARK